MTLHIEGAGGGGGKGGGTSGHTPREDANTLQSQAMAHVVDILSEGPIVGLVGGAQGILFDGTPLQNEDGSFNFPDVRWDFRPGEPDQDAVEGFSDVESEIAVGTEITVSGGAVVRTLTNPDLDDARITLRIPGLSFQDPKRGDLIGSKIEFKIEVQESGAAYRNVEQRWIASTSPTTANCGGLQVTAIFTPPNNSTPDSWWSLRVEFQKSGASTWTVLGEDFGQLREEGLFRQLTGTGTAATVVSRSFSITALVVGVYTIRVVIPPISIPSQTAFTPSGTVRIERILERAENPTLTIAGKTTSPVDVQYRITLPRIAGGPPWNIRITRVTADSAQVNLQNKLFWSSYTEIINARLAYQDSAYLTIRVDSKTFGGNIPTRGFRIKARIIDVPTNYDPVARTYTGIWDGSFKQAWTNNPAWCLWDLCTHKRYGLGALVDQSFIDKWSLYEVGRYCDELVSDGEGGLEPRFTYNDWITQADDAYKLLAIVAGVAHAVPYLGIGALFFAQDSPRPADKLLTNANVEGGEFEYQSTALKARHTAAIVSFNDPRDGFELTPELVEASPNLIERFGYRTAEVTLKGCSSHGQAVREGKWIIDTEMNQQQVMRCVGGFYLADLMPGEIVNILDEFYAGIRAGGRIVDYVIVPSGEELPETAIVILDAPFEIEDNVSYSISVVGSDQSIQTSSIITSAPGLHTNIALQTSFAVAPIDGAVYIITSTTLSPKPWRVQAVNEIESGKFEVIAIEHDPNKYDRVEKSYTLPAPFYSALPRGILKAPLTGNVTEYLYRSGPSVLSAAIFSWDPVKDPRVLTYEVNARGAGETHFAEVGITTASSMVIRPTRPGDWGFRVRAMDGIGRAGSFLVLPNVTLFGTNNLPSTPQNLTIQVVGSTATLVWTPVLDLDLSHYRVKFSPLTSGASWGGAIDLYPRVEGNSVVIPNQIGTFLVKTVDFGGNESATAASVVQGTEAIERLNVVATATEHTAFSGTKANTSVSSSKLRITTTTTIDSFATQSYVEQLGLDFSKLVGAGSYQFNTTIDLGSKFTSRLSFSLTATGLNTDNFMSKWLRLSDVRTLSGADPSDWSAIIQARTTDDNPGGSPTWSAWKNLIVGDYAARAYQFRVLLFTFRAGVTPEISALSSTVDMPDRIAGARNISSGTGGHSVIFSPAFFATPTIGIAFYDGASGDRYALTAISATGFTVEFFSSGGSSVNRTFDWIAKGYGYKQ